MLLKQDRTASAALLPSLERLARVVRTEDTLDLKLTIVLARLDMYCNRLACINNDNVEILGGGEGNVGETKE